MAWPITRLTTYAALSQLLSADMNSIQDAINVLYADEHVNLGLGYQNGAASTLAYRGSPDYWGSLNAGASAVAIPLLGPVGKTISEIAVETVEGNFGTELFTLKIQEIDSGIINQLGDTITTGTTGAVVVQTWNDTTNDTPGEIPFTFAANKRYRILVEFAGTTTDGEAQVIDIRVTQE